MPFDQTYNKGRRPREKNTSSHFHRSLYAIDYNPLSRLFPNFQSNKTPYRLILQQTMLLHLQANPESSMTELATTNLWHPRSNTKGIPSSAPLSARAQEIARSKEEMMSLLKDVPESDYELSLTDLVEKKATKEKELIDDEQTNLMKRKKDGRKKRNSSSSFRSSSDGVLLNFFMPVSLTRSLTTPRGRRVIVHRDPIDCNNRESEAAGLSIGCWPVFLSRRRGKTKQG